VRYQKGYDDACAGIVVIDEHRRLFTGICNRSSSMPPAGRSNNKRQQDQPDSIRTSAEKIDNMIKYIVGAVFPPFLIQTASAATTIDPAYKRWPNEVQNPKHNTNIHQI